MKAEQLAVVFETRRQPGIRPKLLPIGLEGKSVLAVARWVTPRESGEAGNYMTSEAHAWSPFE